MWLFPSLAIGGASGHSIGAVFWTWIIGSLVGGWIIVWIKGGMQEKRARDVFGAARFADDRSEVERAGLKGPD